MKTQYLYLLLLPILLWQSCTKDPNCGDQSDIVNNYTISADDKSKIPFKGTDTLVYISNAGDTATLIGTGKQAFIDEVRKNISGNADCPRNQIDNKETISIEYNGNNNGLNNITYKIIGSSPRTLIEYTINVFYSNDYPYYFNTPSFYTDSTLISGVFYSGNPLNNSNYKTLYNYKYGFLKIEFNGGKIWLLKI